MPKTKFQNVVFTLMMSFLMVYAMICYNISMNIGGMTKSGLSDGVSRDDNRCGRPLLSSSFSSWIIWLTN